MIFDEGATMAAQDAGGGSSVVGDQDNSELKEGFESATIISSSEIGAKIDVHMEEALDEPSRMSMLGWLKRAFNAWQRHFELKTEFSHNDWLGPDGHRLRALDLPAQDERDFPRAVYVSGDVSNDVARTIEVAISRALGKERSMRKPVIKKLAQTHIDGLKRYEESGPPQTVRKYATEMLSQYKVK